ncbi:MAG: site-2 protease family protein [Desulfobacteraceae bacterium]|nr:site-2 protease family protein [Desulfobacteraceae bacterium]
MPNLSEGFLWYLAFLFSAVVHEASHAYTAMKLGDNTAYKGGQVTLDPLPHIKREPFGTIVVPILSFLAGGWMIGWASAPYNPEWARNYPERSAFMSLAGPASNLVLVIVAGLTIRLGIVLDIFYAPDSINLAHIVASRQPGMMEGTATLLSILFSLNILLFAFNLIPLPPLDGSGIIVFFLNKNRAVAYIDFIQSTNFLLIGLLFAWKIFYFVFDPLHLMFINLLYPEFGYK